MEVNRNDKHYWKHRAESGMKVIKEAQAGRPQIFKSPSELWDFACQYFERCDSSPWIRNDFKGKDNKKVEIPTAAPYLWSGFEDFLFEKGICTTLKDYRTASRKKPEDLEEKYKFLAEFAEVIRAIDKIMTSQKISGGLVNAYNSNLVARLEGLVDKKEEVGNNDNKRPQFIFIDKTIK